jgi:hypothetical protein
MTAAKYHRTYCHFWEMSAPPAAAPCVDCSTCAATISIEKISRRRAVISSAKSCLWDRVYADIAAHLRADNTVQQHVRDHLRDFAAVRGAGPARATDWPEDGKEAYTILGINDSTSRSAPVF